MHKFVNEVTVNELDLVLFYNKDKCTVCQSQRNRDRISFQLLQVFVQMKLPLAVIRIIEALIEIQLIENYNN